MRPHLLIIALALASQNMAQTDTDNVIKDRMARAGAVMEDDMGPFQPNAFIGSFRMELHHTHGATKTKSAPMQLEVWTNVDHSLVRSSSGGIAPEMTILKDLRGKKQYLLTTDDLGKRVALKSALKKMVPTGDGAANAPDIRMTEETRVIAGQVCKKLVAKDDRGTWIGWMATDLEVPFTYFMQSLGYGEMIAADQLDGVYGFPLQYEWTDASGTEGLTCVVEDLVVGAVKAEIFTLDGYQIVELPATGQ